MLNSIDTCQADRKIEMWGNDEEGKGYGDVVFEYVDSRKVDLKVGNISPMIRSEFLSVVEQVKACSRCVGQPERSCDFKLDNADLPLNPTKSA